MIFKNLWGQSGIHLYHCDISFFFIKVLFIAEIVVLFTILHLLTNMRVYGFRDYKVTYIK